MLVPGLRVDILSRVNIWFENQSNLMKMTLLECAEESPDAHWVWLWAAAELEVSFQGGRLGLMLPINNCLNPDFINTTGTGLAHLGVIRALMERGVSVDICGGTSQGGE